MVQEHTRPCRRLVLRVSSLLLAAILWGACSPPAEDPQRPPVPELPASAQPAEPPTPESQARAAGLLERAHQTLAGARTLQFVKEASQDGSAAPAAETVTIRIEAPNRLYYTREGTRAGARESLQIAIVSDGEELIQYLGPEATGHEALVVRQPAPAHFLEIERGGGGSLPLHSFTIALLRGVEDFAGLLRFAGPASGTPFSHVGTDDDGGVTIHRIAISTEAGYEGVVELEESEEGTHLLPRSYTLSIGPDPAHMSVMRLRLRDWAVDEPLGPGAFAFTVPAGAREVANLAEAIADFHHRQRVTGHPLAGQPAPDFTLPSSAGGEQVTLSEERAGRVAVLDFWDLEWGAWPALAELADSFAGRNVVFLSINSGAGGAEVRQHLGELGMTSSALLDEDGSVRRRYHVGEESAIFLVAPDGTIREVHKGYNFNLPELLREQLDAMLAASD